MLQIETRELNYIRTILNAAREGTICEDGLEASDCILRGYTLEAAKQQVKENAARRARMAR
jgi:predicted RNase H-like nuclease (RuvC/YqgF family)